jgi:hypothetical protein
MNDEGHEDGKSRGPVIFTVPVLGFVVALNLDRIDRPNPATVSDKTSDGPARPYPDNPTRETKNHANR